MADTSTAIPIDIIVCVHNALEDVQACLESIQTHSRPPFQLILVDDGSAEPTRDYLHAYAQRFPCTLLRNEQAGGYTLAANQGLRHSTAEAVILLNSDTIVTPYWLEELQACADSDKQIGMVGPLSNTASWQSVPNIERQGDWATNPLPDDLSPAQYGKMLQTFSARVYPRLAFLNGFCLYIKRALIDNLGYFDEDNFAQGYGEENDYCLRAGKAGWQLAVCDSAYIYHAQSKSYSHERRKKLADRAGQILVEKHGQALIDQGVAHCRHSRLMQGIRRRAMIALQRGQHIQQGQFFWRDKRVLFVLPVREAGGGGNVVLTEAQAMQRMGVDVRILNLTCHREVFEACHPHNPIPVEYIEHPHAITDKARDYDAVIATANHSVAWLEGLHHVKNPPRLGYYIQDFEPWFYIEKHTERLRFWRWAWLRRRLASWYFRKHEGFRHAWSSYLHPLIRFSKTEWNRQEVSYQTGSACEAVGVSFDSDRFVARTEYSDGDDSVHIVAMVRPSSPRRAPSQTMRVLKRLKQQYSDKVRISIFGCEADDPLYQNLPRDFDFSHLGLLNTEQIADVFNHADIFVDFSHFQAMGLTAMEAMSCGLTVILPQTGGTAEFARHQHNAWVVDSFDEQDCYQALKTLFHDQSLRHRLAEQAAWDLAGHYPEKSALRLLKILFSP